MIFKIFQFTQFFFNLRFDSLLIIYRCKSNGRAMTQRKKFPSELVFPDRGQKKEWALSPQGSIRFSFKIIPELFFQLYSVNVSRLNFISKRISD